MTSGLRCGISWAAYALPQTALTIPDLVEKGLAVSSAKQLSQLGFKRVYVAGNDSAYSLGQTAVEKVLRASQYDPRDIDVFIHASALPVSTRSPRRIEALFRYPATALQYQFGLTRATVMGVAQAGCVSMLNAIRIAKSLLVAEPEVNRVLCLSSDVLPATARREILYNLISDGAAAVIVERSSPRNELVAFSQISKGVYWESDYRGDEIVAAYFSTARTVMQEALAKAKLRMDDIAMVLPHNVNRKSWQILSQFAEIPQERLFLRNIAAVGHTIAADNVINLCDATRRESIKPGDYLMLFSFGFGAHWACTIVRH